MDKFKQWMRESSASQKAAVADGASTSMIYLYQLAAGTREAGAALAGRLEAAFKKWEPKRGITRGDLSSVCSECPYFKRCKGKSK
jgi:hypothetical protein